ncbi:MAG: hypothetical protein ACFCGT_13335 [Sandaracinaceae bacterium]
MRQQLSRLIPIALVVFLCSACGASLGAVAGGPMMPSDANYQSIEETPAGSVQANTAVVSTPRPLMPGEPEPEPTREVPVVAGRGATPSAPLMPSDPGWRHQHEGEPLPAERVPSRPATAVAGR